MSGKKHINAVKFYTQQNNADHEKSDSKVVLKKEVLRLELLISVYMEPLESVLEETKMSIERKMTLTLDEYSQRLVKLTLKIINLFLGGRRGSRETFG